MKRFFFLICVLFSAVVVYGQQTADSDNEESVDLTRCLSFKAVDGPATVSLAKRGRPEKIGLQFSLDDGKTWCDYMIGQVISLDEGTKVFFKAKSFNATFGNKCCKKRVHRRYACRRCLRYTNCRYHGDIPYYNFVMTGFVAADGNIMSLLDKNMDNEVYLPCYAFYKLFADCESLVQAPQLPSMELSWQCYDQMFLNCKSLREAPALPATELSDFCYTGMFSGCVSLLSTPLLPATEMKFACYRYMFDGCTSLVEVTDLPAKDLDDYCYAYMFRNCTSLTKLPQLPDDCEDAPDYWNEDVFKNTGSTLTGDCCQR